MLSWKSVPRVHAWGMLDHPLTRNLSIPNPVFVTCEKGQGYDRKELCHPGHNFLWKSKVLKRGELSCWLTSKKKHQYSEVQKKEGPLSPGYGKEQEDCMIRGQPPGGLQNCDTSLYSSSPAVIGGIIWRVKRKNTKLPPNLCYHTAIATFVFTLREPVKKIQISKAKMCICWAKNSTSSNSP